MTRHEWYSGLSSFICLVLGDLQNCFWGPLRNLEGSFEDGTVLVQGASIMYKPWF